jgi:hypothetical protein
VTLRPTSLFFRSVGDTAQVSALILYDRTPTSQQGPVAWTSSEPSIAGVSSSGLVTAVGTGTASITASYGDATAAVSVSVDQVAASISFSPDGILLVGPGDSLTVTMSVLDAGGFDIGSAAVTWQVDDEGIAAITETGLVTALASGSTTMTVLATSGGRTISRAIQITVGNGVLVGPSGGRASFEDHGVTLDFSAGAVSEPVFITAAPAVWWPAEPLPIPGTALDFGPEGISFAGPVTLTVRYDPAHLPEGVPETRLGLYELVAGEYVPVPETTVDEANHAVTGRISGFSVFAVLPQLVVETTSLPEGIEHVDFGTVTLTATGGSGTYSWTLAPGSDPLPPGLNLGPNGHISGTPTSAGTWSLTVLVTSGALSIEHALSITVLEPLGVSTTSLPDGIQDSAYGLVTLTAHGGVGDHAWSLASGSLPRGLILSVDGEIAGTPTVPGTSSFTVEVTSGSQTAVQTLSITVVPELIAAIAPLPDGVQDVPYRPAMLRAQGGVGNYAWSLASGALPPGLTLAANGVIRGTPAVDGTSSFTVEVTSGAQTARQTLSITVLEPLVVTTTSLPDVVQNAGYGPAMLTAHGGIGGYAWFLTSGALPPGLTLAANGDIAGTPTVTGTSTFLVRVSSGTQTAQRALSITVLQPLVVITTSLPDAVQNATYGPATLTAHGGIGGYAWSLASGSLPQGLTLGPSGDVTGIPKATGTASFMVRVASGSQTAQQTLSITVLQPLAITTTSLPGGVHGVAYGPAALTAQGGVGGYVWSLASGSLPPGLTLGAGGGISGTPTVAGASSFTVRVTSGAQTAHRTLSVTVAAVLVGAGDIAGCSWLDDEATAAVLDGIQGTVFTTGDNAYPDATPQEFANCYHPSWGRHKQRTRPSVGNHDYNTASAAGYYGYFGAAAGDPTKGYYSYDLGAWHIVVLNSTIETHAGSPQLQWLAADLAANPRICTLAYWHRPRFSSGLHGSSLDVKPFWDVLHAAGADVVLAGHDHDYERFAAQDPNGAADPVNGIRQFVVGTGGSTLRAFSSTAANSEARDHSTWGVLKLTLFPSHYQWQFVPAGGSGFTDSGSGGCH